MRSPVRHLVIPASVGVACLLVVTISGLTSASAQDAAAIRQNMIESSKTSCAASARQSSGGRLSEDKISVYCDCFSDGLSDSLTDAEVLDAARDESTISPALQAKIQPLVQACAAKMQP